jgi:hypothetical protein
MGVEGGIVLILSAIGCTPQGNPWTAAETTVLLRLDALFGWILHLECWHVTVSHIPICCGVSILIYIQCFTGS